MPLAKIEPALLGVLREVAADPGLWVAEATPLGDIEDWDSLSTVEAILLIESRSWLKLAVEDLEAVATVGALSALVAAAGS